MPSQVGIPRINHQGSYEISSSQLPPQNEMAPFVRSTTSVRGFNEQIPNGEDATGILPRQEGTLDQLPLNNQVNENNSFSMDEFFF